MRISDWSSDVCSSDLRLAVADGHAEHLTPAVGVDAHGDDDCDRDDVVITPGFDVGGVEPDIGPLALDRVAEEGLHPLVDLAAQPRHLALADAIQAHGAHPIVDRTGDRKSGEEGKRGSVRVE